jgi:1,4-alpha-glucan branching enzyme
MPIRARDFHPDWNTAIYNFGRREVSSFLVNNALFWGETYHVDGLRVDAVASMLYLDYSRKEGEWIPNKDGGRENLDAVEFLKTMNKAVYGSHPGIVTIAEESTSWPKVSAPVHEGGLGFGFKWNMGFMHDTLSYMQRDPIHRKHHHGDMTFGLLYAFSENFVLPISHDEVVHGKGSMLTKMAGDEWQKFASICEPITASCGVIRARSCCSWDRNSPSAANGARHGLSTGTISMIRDHHGMQDLVRDLNRLYAKTPALHARDCEPEGFEWMIADDA